MPEPASVRAGVMTPNGSRANLRSAAPKGPSLRRRRRRRDRAHPGEARVGATSDWFCALLARAGVGEGHWTLR